MDILSSVNGKKIESLDAFYSVLKTSQEEKKPINFVFRDTGGKGKPSYFTYTERTLPVENLTWVSNEKNGS